jgi:LytS/YehU family sensor histidine kinase
MVGWLEAPLQAVVEENGRQMLATAEMRRSDEQPRVEVLERDNRQLSEANEIAKQSVGTALSKQNAKVKQDLVSPERALTRLTMTLSQTEEAVERQVGALE